MSTSSSLLTSSSPYTPSTTCSSTAYGLGARPNPVDYRPCMYTVQGNMVCGLDDKDMPKAGCFSDRREDAYDGFGDPQTVRRLRSSIGFQDPFGYNTSPRYNNYDGLILHQTRDGERLKAPCCRCECEKVGPCNDPWAVVKDPTAKCVLCETGACNRFC